MQKPPNKKQCYSNNKNNTFCDKHLFQHRLAQQFPNLYFSIAEDFCSAPLLWHIHSYCFKTPLNLILNYRTATLIEQREHNYCCFIWSWIPAHCGTKKRKKELQIICLTIFNIYIYTRVSQNTCLHIWKFMYNLNTLLAVAHKHVRNVTPVFYQGCLLPYVGTVGGTDGAHYECKGVISPSP